MAGLFSRLFRRGSRRAVAQLPQSVETVTPTSVQLVKQLVAGREPVAGEQAEKPPGEPAEHLRAPAVEQLPAPPAESAEQFKAAPEQFKAAPEQDAESEQEGEISPTRLEAALQRLREEHPPLETQSGAE